MAGGTLFIKILPEKGAEKAIQAAVERGGAGAEQSGQDSGSRFGIGFAAAAGTAIGRGLQIAGRTEQSRIALTQLTGSAKTAQDTLAQLSAFAANTPFELQGLQRNAVQLLGVGVEAEDLIPTLTSLGDTTASLGLSQANFDSVLRAVTQSMAKGKIQQEELLQIAEAGVPIYGLLSDALGVSEQELLNMASAGELAADDVFPRLFAQMDKDYGGGLAAQSQTLNGVLSNLSDTIDSGLGAAVEFLIPLLADFLPDAASAASGVIVVFGNGLQAAVTLATPLIFVLQQLLAGFGALPEPLQTALIAALLLGRVMGGPGVIGSLITFTTTLYANRAAIIANAQAAGTFTGALGAVARGAAGAAGTTGLKGLASALVGGGWGIAIVGAGLLIAKLIDVSGYADDARQKMSDITDGIDLSSYRSTSDGLAELQAQLNSSVEAATKASIFGPLGRMFSDADENASAAADAIAELGERTERYTTNSRALANELGISVTQLEALARAGELDLNLLAGDDEDIALFREQLEGTNAAVEAGIDPTSAFGQAVAVLGDKASTTADRSNALIDALRALTGGQIDARRAASNWQEALAGVAEALGAVDDEGNNVGIAGARAALGMDFSTEAARNAGAAFDEANGRMLEQVQAAYNTAAANGDLAGASAAAGAAAQAARNDFIAQATQLGLTQEEAAALADAYGFIPANVVTAISTPGMDQTQADLGRVQAQLIGLPPNTPVTVDALTAEARQRLTNLGFTVRDIPGSKQVTVSADTAQATRDLDALTRPRSVTVTVATRGSIRAIEGGALNAEGARMEYFAGGGLRAYGRTLTPMAANWAKVVPANTWRVIGDRAVGREWFIPEDAPNTLALLNDAAHAHGLRLVAAMADGGLLGGAPTPLPASGGRVTNIQNTLNAAPGLPTIDQLQRMQRRAEVLADA